MKLRTHYLIARTAARRCGLNSMKQLSFCIGSLIPDLSFSQIFRPHFFVSSGYYVFTKLRKLSGKSSLIAFAELGKISHYASDFCCSVHIDGKVGNLREHLRYERRMDKFVYRNYPALSEKCTELTGSSSLNAVLAEYRECDKFDFTIDFIMAVQASEAVCRTAALSPNVSSGKSRDPYPTI
ncbi:MAG: zinc dependent phospholipase C family protein [Ruminococcus sp.]|nr:zinc dependent phospholipase C family protein [Ruminococcus sp.]